MDTFYAELAPIEHFLDITSPDSFTAVPGEWLVALTDVKDSTAAITAGHYKSINMIGAASIVALLNIAGGIDIPFVFGGDGATLLIPPSLIQATTSALLGVRALARREFALELRISLVPVAELVAAGYQLNVAKLQVSDSYVQAMFSGGGLSYAEQLIKDPLTADGYMIQGDDSLAQADLTGLECRWRDITSTYGETVSLLVRATTGTAADDNRLYRALLDEMAACYGDEQDYHPVALEMLRPSFDPKNLRFETQLRSQPQWLGRHAYLWKIWVQNLLLKLFVAIKLVTRKTRWATYPPLVRQTVDYKKFDDTLRMVVAGTVQQREALTRWLDEHYERGQLVYGLHTSDRAVMTCLVFERMGYQIHFVDAADGGYAVAAQRLKERLQSRTVVAV